MYIFIFLYFYIFTQCLHKLYAASKTAIPSTAETWTEMKCSSSLYNKAIVRLLAFARGILYPIKAEMKQGTVD